MSVFFWGCVTLFILKGVPFVSILHSLPVCLQGWRLEEWWAWFSSLARKAGGVSTIIAARSRICTEAGRGNGVVYGFIGENLWAKLRKLNEAFFETWNCGFSTTCTICNNPCHFLSLSMDVGSSIVLSKRLRQVSRCSWKHHQQLLDLNFEILTQVYLLEKFQRLLKSPT